MKKSTFPKMHVSIYVSDINKTVDFYSSFFGQHPEKIKADYAKFVLDEPALIISFVQNKDRVQQNFGHFGFQVDSAEEVKKRLAQVQGNGMPILEEMQTSCCYALQDKFWVTDPDGVQWEVYYFHKDVTFNDPKYSSESSTACCTPSSEKKRVNLAGVSTENEACC